MNTEECIKSILQTIKRNCEVRLNDCCKCCIFYNKNIEGECCFGWGTPADFWDIEHLANSRKEL